MYKMVKQNKICVSGKKKKTITIKIKMPKLKPYKFYAIITTIGYDILLLPLLVVDVQI